MSKVLRRFEILLPLRFNNGRSVPNELIADTLLEHLPTNREFFVKFKERLKARFEQLDIWMTTYPIEVLQARTVINELLSKLRRAEHEHARHGQ